MITEPKTVHCRNCNRPFTRTHQLTRLHGDGGRVWYCKPKCRNEARARRQRARRHEQAIYTTATPVAYCRDHETRFSASAVRKHANCDWIVVRPCLHCGNVPNYTGTYRPDGTYCTEECFRQAWLVKLDFGQLATTGDIVYDPRYVRANNLDGALTGGSYEELFGTDDEPLTGYQLIDLAEWTSNDSIMEHPYRAVK